MSRMETITGEGVEQPLRPGDSVEFLGPNDEIVYEQGPITGVRFFGHKIDVVERTTGDELRVMAYRQSGVPYLEITSRILGGVRIRAIQKTGELELNKIFDEDKHVLLMEGGRERQVLKNTDRGGGDLE